MDTGQEFGMAPRKVPSAFMCADRRIPFSACASSDIVALFGYGQSKLFSVASEGHVTIKQGITCAEATLPCPHTVRMGGQIVNVRAHARVQAGRSF